MSSDGRFVTFHSLASTLVPSDTNGFRDVFVHDRQSGLTKRISESSSGIQSNRDSDFPSISADGRFVAMRSLATNLVASDATAAADIFVRDEIDGSIVLISKSTAGMQGNDWSHFPSISGTGRYVAFSSEATNLVPNDSNGLSDIFVHDRETATTVRASVSSAGAQADGQSFDAAISSDGRYVAFRSNATNLVTTGSASYAVYIRDLASGTTVCGSLALNGTPAGGWAPAISSDGRYVSFYSSTSVLVPEDTNNLWDVFVSDLQTGNMMRVVANSQGSDGTSVFRPSLSADGRFVAFESAAQNLVPDDVNGVADVFLQDRVIGVTLRLSVDTAGTQGNAVSISPSMSADASVVAFHSSASNLVPSDTNGDQDVFVRDPSSGSFASLCAPGVEGVTACPCSNPPAGSLRGCDNSSGTGGATLSVSGWAYLTADSLHFTTSGEPASALSFLIQGNAAVTSGVTFGQGVRCVGGTIVRRLFFKAASGGVMTAPDATVGDLSVSAESAVQGDVIQPGESRYYLVYYRDPVVLGGCPASSAFNATQTSRVSWSL